MQWRGRLWIGVLAGLCFLLLAGCAEEQVSEDDEAGQAGEEPTLVELGLRLAPAGLTLTGLSQAEADQVAHGSYLVNGASAGCSCHAAPAGYLAGGMEFPLPFRDVQGFPSVFARNLTPDPDTRLQLTEAEFIEAMRTGKDFTDSTAAAPHGFPDAREQFENDTILINVDLDVRVQLFALAATYGVTDRLDVGIVIPITHVEMDVKSRARVVQSPENTLFPGVHSFVGPGADSPDDAASGEATGFGDIVLRAKYHLFNSDVVDLAGAMLVKLATGDADNFLGTGTTTVRPFLVLSRTFPNVFLPRVNFTPHLNLGFEFNLDHNDKHAVKYVVGFDLGTRRVTIAAEFLGSHEPNGDGIGDNILTAAMGVKWNPWKQLLLTANAQFPLNDEGLRSHLIPTFGVEYSF
jgi:Putative MetA-pathway of phenol degradation